MEIEGLVTNVLEKKSGTSQRTGQPWASQEYVIEMRDPTSQYPRHCVFRVFGEDRINQFAIKNGEWLRVSIDIDAHEWQGRWFNNINAWRVDRIDPAQAQAGQPTAAAAPQAAPAQTAQPASDAQAPFPPAAQDSDSAADDLPF